MQGAGLDERLELERRLCRASLIDCVLAVAPWFVIEEVHLAIAAELEALERGEFDRLMIFMPPRGGKLVAHDVPVFTTAGWKSHGDLRVGDHVFGPDGLPTRVVALSSDDEAAVEVELTNGEVIPVHENHEWTVWDRTCQKYRTVETGYWLETTKFGKRRLVWFGERGKRGGRALYNLPDVAPLQLPERDDLPICPYVLGVWLGDGTTGKPCITHHKDEDVLWRAIETAGYAVTGQWGNRQHPNVMVTTFSGPRPRVKGPLGNDLCAAGVYTEKRIPEAYILASVEQRVQLLAGLIDTDGTVDHKGRVTITTASPLLRDDIVDLLTSLSQRPYFHVVQPGTSSSGITSTREHYVIGFQPSIPIPTKLFRKKIRRLVTERRRVGIADVRRCCAKPGRCIQVDRGDGLYLVGRSMVPTHNSETISKLFPAWYLGRRPNEKVMHITHTADMTKDFGRAIRDLIADPIYQRIFPGIALRDDVKAAGRWMIQHGDAARQQGEYFAAGVGGGIAGRGWNLGIIDDPLSEQSAMSDIERARVRGWYGPGFYTRRQPDRNAIVIMSTRWAHDDLPGHLLEMQENDPAADRWRVLSLPAILDDESAALLNQYTERAAFYDTLRRRGSASKGVWTPESPIHYRAGDSYAPRRWPLKELERTRGQSTERHWSALFLQRPVAEGGHILKRDAWREWKQKEPPECYEIIACYDTAIEEEEEADYSARTTWGLFEFQGMTNAILIEAWRDHLSPHEILAEMTRHTKEFKVDRLLIEKRASGSWLVKEGRRRNLPTRAWLPPGGPRSKGKVPRAHAASVVLEGGAVWYVNRRWAQTVIDECSDLPFGKHDDLADTTTMALLFLRERWRVELKVDHQDDEPEDEEFEPLERQLAGIYG